MRFIPVPSVGRYFRGAFHLHELCPLSPPLPDRLAVARTLRARWQKPALSARHGFVGTRCYIIWTATAGQGARPFSFPTLACAWVSQSCSRCAPGPGQLLLQQRRGGRRTLHVHESGLGAVGCWRQYQHPHVGARCPHIWTRRVSPNRLPAEHKPLSSLLQQCWLRSAVAHRRCCTYRPRATRTAACDSGPWSWARRRGRRARRRRAGRRTTSRRGWQPQGSVQYYKGIAPPPC